MASKASFLGYKLPIYVIDPTLIPDESMEQDLYLEIVNNLDYDLPFNRIKDIPTLITPKDKSYFWGYLIQKYSVESDYFIKGYINAFKQPGSRLWLISCL